MITFTAKIEELNGQAFIRIPDIIVKEHNLKIGDEVTLKILRKTNKIK